MTVTACEGHRAANTIVAHWEIPPANRVSRGNTEILAKIMDSVPQLIWSTTPNGLLEYGNSAWKSAVSADYGVPVESALLPRLHNADQEAWRQQWLAALRTGEAYEFEYRLETLTQDSRRWLLERGTPVRDAKTGELQRWIMTGTPIDRYKRTEETLRLQLNQRDDFLATVLHELRNPLTPIAGALERLGRSPNDALSVGVARGIIQRQLRQLSCLVDDLLDVSRISHGGIRLQRRIVELKDIVVVAVETAGPLIDVRQQELTVGQAEQPVHLFADPVRMTQVVTNLLMNAAKFTHRGGHISIVSGEKEGVVSIRVRDNGVGIPADKLPHIFDLYVQAHAGSTAGAGGLGVGLAVARQMVELHGGTLSVRSEGPGRGSEFTVLLPGAHRPIGSLS